MYSYIVIYVDFYEATRGFHEMQLLKYINKINIHKVDIFGNEYVNRGFNPM